MKKIQNNIFKLIVISLMVSVFSLCWKADAYAEEISRGEDIAQAEEIDSLDMLFLLHGSGGDIGEGEAGTIIDDIEEPRNLTGEEILQATAGMTTSDVGVALICKWEGCRLTAYKASSSEKYYTIGYGHYGSDVTEGMTITKEQAVALLKSDVGKFENYLNNFLKKNSLTINQHQFDALISFSYNVGISWMSDSTIRNYLLNGIENYTDEQITNAFCLWSYSNHVFIQGLYNRRQDEAKLFNTKDYLYPSVSSVNLDLKGDIGVNFYVNIPAGIADQILEVVISSDSVGTKHYTLSDNKTNETDLYEFTYNLNVKDLYTQLNIAIYNKNNEKIKLGNNEAYEYIYSFEQYVSDVKKKSDSKLDTLLARLGDYSQATSVYFGKSMDSLTDIGDVTIDNSYEMRTSGSVTGISYMGSSLILESNTRIRHYFSVASGYNINNYTFRCDGKILAPQCKGSLYYIDIENIAASEMDTAYRLSISDNKSSFYYLDYSVLSYGIKGLKNGDTNLCNLIRCMYQYNLAANDYFEQ